MMPQAHAAAVVRPRAARSLGRWVGHKLGVASGGRTSPIDWKMSVILLPAALLRARGWTTWQPATGGFDKEGGAAGGARTGAQAASDLHGHEPTWPHPSKAAKGEASKATRPPSTCNFRAPDHVVSLLEDVRQAVYVVHQGFNPVDVGRRVVHRLLQSVADGVRAGVEGPHRLQGGRKAWRRRAPHRMRARDRRGRPEARESLGRCQWAQGPLSPPSLPLRLGTDRWGRAPTARRQHRRHAQASSAAAACRSSRPPARATRKEAGRALGLQDAQPLKRPALALQAANVLRIAPNRKRKRRDKPHFGWPRHARRGSVVHPRPCERTEEPPDLYLSTALLICQPQIGGAQAHA